jgi:hypothetical protein
MKYFKHMRISASLGMTTLLFLLASCGNRTHQPGPDLRVLDDEYPRAFFFRMAENTYEPYEEWEANLERLMGIEGKALDEEVVGRMERNPEFFTRFKQNHPDQMVLLHFNGNARDPRYRREKFFAGHWIYFPGAEILSDVPPGEDVSEIRVSDATLFKTGIGRYGDRNEDIGLCELDEDGRPDWHKAEQVELLAADTVGHIITVRRASFGTEAREFKAGQAYAAAHVHEGPWGERNHLMWHYNYSTACPLDEEGKSCRDRLVEDVLGYFQPGGELEAFDGVEFDVCYSRVVWPRYLPGDHRIPDVDADGKPDAGFIDGVNTYGKGMLQFLREVRRGLGPDRLILGDGFRPAHQRGFGILNGMESEGWPDGSDHEINGWSGGINRQLYWNENSSEPKMTYINHRWWIHNRMDTTLSLSIERLVMAASCLTGSAIAFSDRPQKEEGETYYPIWDELLGGMKKEVGWLGKPMGPSICLAKRGEDLIGSQDPSRLLELLMDVNADLLFSPDGEWVKVESMGMVKDRMEFTIENVPCPASDLTVYLVMRGRHLAGYASTWGRVVKVTPVGYTHPGRKEGLNDENWYMSWISEEPFESVFYYPGMDQEVATLKVEVEGNDTLWIRNIHAYAGPDARVREFRNGVVLANPAPHPQVFNLAELFPGKDFTRLTGSSRQDTLTNDGSGVDDEVKLSGKDALFLLKE